MRRSIILLWVMAAITLQAQDNWFEAQSDRASVKSIVSTSELVEGQYAGKYIYPPVNLLDGNFDTTWCEAEEGGSGLGESITLELEEPISFDEIQLVNGFASGNDYYHKNNRVAKLTLTQTAGEHFQQKQYDLADDREDWQSITFDLLQTAQIINFRIDEVYRGIKYDDTCFSDVRFLREGRVIPFENVTRIKTAQEEHSRSLLQQESGAFMRQIKAMAMADGATNELYLLNEERSRGIRFSFDSANAITGSSVRLSIDDFSYYPKGSTKFNYDYLTSYFSPEAETGMFASREEFDRAMEDRESFLVIYFDWERDREDFLRDYRLVTRRQIDYVETETVELIKLDGDQGLYINGVYYKRLNGEDLVVLEESP